MTKGRSRWVLTSLASLVVSFGVAEAGLRRFYPRTDRHFVLEPRRTTTLEPITDIMPGVSGAAVYRTSSLGIRGDEFGDESEFRILAIGGSTTQNPYLDQDETWTTRVGVLLRDRHPGMAIWSGDVGRSGHTMREHILQLDRLLAELPRIDVVVMLVGANDLTGRLRQGYSYAPPAPLDDPAVRAARFRQAFTRVPGRLHDRATALQSEDVPRVKRTALFQLAKLARDRWVEARGGTRQDRFGEAYVTWRRHRAQAPQVLDSLPDLTEPLGEYRGLLENAVEIAAARRVRLVLLTQPALWRADLTPAEHRMLWLGGLGDFQERPGQGYFSARTLREGLDAYNATLLDVCLGHSAECVDMASLLVATTTNFYDDVHFTERGSAELARHLAGYLGARPPFAPDSSAAVR